MMLINSGAELDLKDLDGNTALGLSIICNHVNYAVMLL